MSSLFQNRFDPTPKPNPVLHALTPRQRSIIITLSVVGIAPLLLIPIIRHAIFLAICSLGGTTCLLFLRWRIPALKGGVVPFILALLAFLAAITIALSSGA